MCSAILDMYYFGFTFTYDHLGYTCHVETISFKQPLCDEKMTTCWCIRNKSCKKSLFPCPRLEFKDLETDERIVVPLDHYISGSHLSNSYFSYLEEGGAIYPQKYAHNVNVEKIDTVLENKYRGFIESESDHLIRQSLFLSIKNMKESGKSEYMCKRL